METVIQDKQQSNPERQPRWDRFERADLFAHLRLKRSLGAVLTAPETILRACGRT